MVKKNAIKLFEGTKVRTVWDDETEEWYFSVVDVVAALTDSTNPTDYLKKMRKRDPELGAYIGTNCPQKPLGKASVLLAKVVMLPAMLARISRSE